MIRSQNIPEGYLKAVKALNYVVFSRYGILTWHAPAPIL